MGDLNQSPRAVACIVFATTSASVIKVYERGEAVADELVRFSPLNIGDEADAACVVFHRGVVKPLRLGSG